ncbi:hypothetical protein KKJ30_00050 [Xenorhabdus bovienii]|nr:hypothetical protein [Xenorhabdus bovienii]MDE9480212.1 hypothetical protein [Xenorhabdus bovienii]
MTVATIRIDLAKNIFAIHDVDNDGNAVLVKPKVPRHRLIRQNQRDYTQYSCAPRQGLGIASDIPQIAESKS